MTPRLAACRRCRSPRRVSRAPPCAVDLLCPEVDGIRAGDLRSGRDRGKAGQGIGDGLLEFVIRPGVVGGTAGQVRLVGAEVD